MKEDKDYIDKLVELRIDRDKTQKEIAKQLQTSQTAVSKWELRQRKLTIEDLRILCLYYKVSADWLLNLPYHPEQVTSNTEGRC
ncbi:MAG: helix-turn-helix transcriptional regulator [Clostridia bacterium]|nr:helix-turn-helix transcriptional regulator [Clostridia bacterium]